MKRRTFQTLALAGMAGSYGNVRAQSGRPRIRIGQIGTRHAHAGGQLAALRQCPDFEVIGVVEPDGVQRKAMAQTEDYAGLPWMTEEELLNTPGLQAVSVETEVGRLLDSGEKVVQAGFHLHLDKPAGESLPQLQRILDTASSRQRLVKMGYMFRYNPAFQLLMRAVQEGWLGEVFSIHAEMSKLLGEADRKRLVPYAGGSMFELGCHLIDSVVRILGRPDSVSPHIRRSRGDGYADNMTAVLDYPKATVTLRSAMIEVDGGARRQFVVCGTKGTIEIRPLEPPAMKLTLDQPRDKFRKGAQAVAFENAPRYAADWLDFARAIRGDVAWEFTPKHDIAVQETVLKASGLPVV